MKKKASRRDPRISKRWIWSPERKACCKIFITETGEHLDDTESNLLRLEQQPDDAELLNEIFRSIHTIKGSAEYLGMERIAELSHKLESLLDLLRRGEREADKQIIEVLIGANDRIGQLVSDLEQHQEEKTDIDELVGRIERFTGEVEQGAVEETEAAAQTAAVEGDVYEDEYDEELFSIFLEQLKDGLSALKREADRLLAGEDADGALEQCTERLNTLRVICQLYGLRATESSARTVVGVYFRSPGTAYRRH